MRSHQRLAGAMLVGLGLAFVALPAAAYQLDPRYPGEQPQESRDAFPKKPQKVIARTGELKITPTYPHVGDTVTATLSNLNAVAWGITCPAGAKFVGERVPATEADDIPLGSKGGPISCSFKVNVATTNLSPLPGVPSNPWVKIEAFIAGPCGRPSAVKAGKAEFAICASGHSDDSYMVLPGGNHDVSGSVSGVKDEPIAGMDIEITDKDGVTTKSVTDLNGRYGFYLQENATYTLKPGKFENRNYGVLGPDDFSPKDATISGSGSHTADFKVKGPSLSGKVTDTKGSPMGGAVVEARSNKGPEQAVVKADGSYQITLPKGSYSVRVVSPAPPDPNRHNRFWGGSYYCSPVGTDKRDFCFVALGSDRSGVDFVAATELKLKMTVSKPAAATFQTLAYDPVAQTTDAPGDQARDIVTVQVTDDFGNPVGGQDVEFTPQTSLSPRMLVEDENGYRLWPDQYAIGAAVAAGAAALTPDQNPPFKLQTDDQGMIAFDCWPGSQGGDWKISADIPGSNDPQEKTDADVTVPKQNDRMPADQDLSTSIDNALAAGIPHPAGSPNSINQQDPNGALNQALHALTSHGSNSGASFTPIHSSDGRHGGILIMPKSPPSEWLQRIGSYMQGSGKAPSEIPARVLDTDFLTAKAKQPGFDSWSKLGAPPLPKVDEWLTQLGDTTARPQLGDLSAHYHDTEFLSYFGFPSIPERIGPLDRAAEVQASTFVAERPIDQPGYFTFTDSLGRRVSEDPSGNAKIDIPGATVRTDPTRKVVQYDLPRGKYTIDFTGTRSGKALLGVTHGDVNEAMKVWRFGAQPGVSGTGAYDAELTDLQYGEKRIQRDNGLGIKSNIGLPKTMAQDSLKTYPVSVTDELGAPLPHAVVNIDTGAFNASAWTDANGKADIRVYGPPVDSPITATVKAADHVPITQKLKGGPPGPADVPDAVRKVIGPEQAVYIPAKPEGGGPLGVIELAAVLALSGAGLTYARTRAG